MSEYIKTNVGTKINTEIDTEINTCNESLASIKRHLIDPIAKIVVDYTKKYKFKGKRIEKIDLSYTVCCDENKKYDHATSGPTVLFDVVAVDDDIFILNNCFNISVYNHINKQMTREFELDLQCNNFHHYSGERTSFLFANVMAKSRVWEFSHNGEKKEISYVKMFISKLNNEILLLLPYRIILVFNSLNGNFIRKFMIGVGNVTFDGEHLYVVRSRYGGSVHVDIVNILDGSIIRKWENKNNKDNKRMYNLTTIKATTINKNIMYILGTHDKFTDHDMVFTCDAADGKNMRSLKNTTGFIYSDVMVYDDYVYTYDCIRDIYFNVYDIAEDNNEKLLSKSIVSGLIDYKIILHYGKLFLIKRQVCLKGRTWLEKSTAFNVMLKSNTSHANDEVANSIVSNNDDIAKNIISNDGDVNDIVLNEENNSCLDIDSNNRIQISLYVIH